MKKNKKDSKETPAPDVSQLPAEFLQLGIQPLLLQAIAELGFQTPTPVQKEVIPHLLTSTNDLIGLAQTGTGKTAAFGLPLIQLTDTETLTTQVLIICPTRELCLQITRDFLNFARYMKKLRIVPVFGGSSIEIQSRELRHGAQIIVATPGRLLDMIRRQKADISRISVLVLDEADEMLNMGFKEELNAILQSAPVSRRTLLFSATMSRDIERLALDFMHDPIEVVIGKKNEGAENVSHVYYLVHARDRYLALKRIIDFHPGMYAIIFCRTKVETHEVADKLMADGYNADSLHGDLSQAQRDSVMQKFRQRSLELLVATDVAARGLDVDGLTHIINYNLPDDNEQYTHRSGRTGRAGKLGLCISLVNLKEKFKIKAIEKTIGKKFKQERIPAGREICEKQLFRLIDRVEKIEVLDEEIAGFLPVIFEKLSWLERDDLIKRFVSIEFNTMLEYYKKTQDINVNEKMSQPGWCRFFLNLGHKQDLTPPALIGLINDISRRLSIRIGRIEIKHSFSFFEADNEYADLILDELKQKTWHDQRIFIEKADANRPESASPKKFSGKKKRPHGRNWEKPRGK